MRLTQDQIDAIRTSAVEAFTPDAEVRLFGSRVDEAKKGGDIALWQRLGDDLAEWSELRKTRNRLIHDHEDAPDRATAALQHTIDVAAPLMLAVHDRAESYILS